MAQKKGVRKRKCVRCARGEEVFRNEAGGLRAYESYWHFNKRFNNSVECIDGVHHEADRLRRDNEWLIAELNKLRARSNQ